MGGLRQYMPFTWVADVDRHARDRGHPAVRRLLLEGRDPRRRCSRARTQSTLAEAHWFGIPGQRVLYVVYVLGLAAALLTAIYMTRMMLYTFHGPNRTGEKEREAPARGAVGHDRSARRARRAERRRRLAQPPGVHARRSDRQALRALARAGRRRVDAARHARRGRAPRRTRTEYALIGAAVAIAVAGIAIACARLKPAALVPKAQAPPEQGLRARAREQVLRRRALRRGDRAARRSASRDSVLWRGIDVGLIDGLLVNGSGVPRARRRLGRLAAAVRAGRHVRLGARHRRAGRARRLHSSADPMTAFLQLDRTTDAGSSRRCWSIPVARRAG